MKTKWIFHLLNLIFINFDNLIDFSMDFPSNLSQTMIDDNPIWISLLLSYPSTTQISSSIISISKAFASSFQLSRTKSRSFINFSFSLLSLRSLFKAISSGIILSLDFQLCFDFSRWKDEKKFRWMKGKFFDFWSEK